MPTTIGYFYQDSPGDVPVFDWLKDLKKYDRKGFAKCVAKIQRLEALGHELRRPEADYLEDGIYELRAKKGHVNYRILYFFHGQKVAILTHAFAKEDKIPPVDLTRAKNRKKTFERTPDAHTAPLRLSSD
jgi:phage-related protein